MSFWKRLFGGGDGGEAETAKPVREVEHKGFTIQAAPYKSEGQYQVAGVVSKEIGGQRREHRFVRADRMASLDDATEISIMKGRQMIDQLGDRLFD